MGKLTLQYEELKELETLLGRNTETKKEQTPIEQEVCIMCGSYDIEKLSRTYYGSNGLEYDTTEVHCKNCGFQEIKKNQ